MADSVDVHRGGKKRSRNPQEWKREKRKRLRIAGKEYINTRGELVSSRKIGGDCKCRRNCYVNVSEEVRKKLFEGYYSLNSHDEQNAYLFGLIRKKDIARKRSKDSVRRTCTYTYYVRNRGKEIQVCRLAFAHIHGISSPKIRNLCLKLDMNVMFPRDGRGKHDHRPKKIADETMEQIRKHINSIVRSDRVSDFMKEEKINGPDVNITKMWKDYLCKYEPDIDINAVSSKTAKKVENMDSQNNSQHETTPDNHQPQNSLIESSAQIISQYGLIQNQPGDHFINLDIRDSNANSCATSGTKAQQDGEHGSQSDDDSEGDDLTVRNRKPLVKHWLYSKIFHDELKFHDLVSLRKKLWDFKGEKMTTTKMSSSQNSLYLSSCLSKPQLINDSTATKSERKQKKPKKVACSKGLGRLDQERTPDLLTRGSTTPSAPSHDFHPPDMYILPVQLQDMQSQHPHQKTSLLAMDLGTSQQTHLAHHQHHVGTQINLHSFASLTGQPHNSPSPHRPCADEQQHNSGQLHPLSSSIIQSVNLSPKSCTYINVQSQSFY